MEKEIKKNPFAVLEEEVLDFWQKNKIFEKSVEKEAPEGDYVFYDGPPFATGTPHYGHIVASIIKDVVPRFWTMNGYRVERKWGWDCHGLPIENIVEKELGSKRKSDIEKIGVEKFNEMCRSKVTGYVDDWKLVIAKLGRWADMENDYKTMDLPFMESVWYVFKTMYDKGLIYEGYRSMHVCPRCETTLSQSEVAEGYKDIKDLSCIAEFRIKNLELRIKDLDDFKDKKTSILAWTTTPWTLIGNTALAVGADIDYVMIAKKDEGEGEIVHFILAKEKLKDLFDGQDYEIVKKFKGADLVGLEYEPLFDYYSTDENLENRENGWKVYAGDFVTTDEGTGVVHIAPAFGDDDMQLGKKHNLPFVQHLSIDGYFKPEVKDFPGLNVKPIDNHMATDIEIIKYLAHHDLLFAKEKYEHSYPHCWRCDTPLLNYATSSWFVDVTKIKQKMLNNAEPINWSPAHIKKGRWGNWLEGARDWSISRQRFWASVMPIWECDKACGERVVVGSVKELEDLSGVKVDDLHKHVVDKISFDCKCGGTMRRIPDVLDTWFDSGSMPFAQMHYPFENKEKFEKNFPAEFIAEGTDQTRCWFYYMHVLASGTKDTNAFNNVIVNGIVLAEDGKKMSKKLKNYPDPLLIFEKYGADALRYYLLTSPVMLADNLNFSEKGVSDALRKINMTLWNVLRFYDMFNQDSKINVKEDGLKASNVLDKWILVRLNQLIEEVDKGMKNYNLPEASRPIAKFIDDLSTWYLRRSRDRFKGVDEKDKTQALKTTKFVLEETAKIIAPFTPFIAEQVWQKVSGFEFKDENRSVHLENWSVLDGEVDGSDEILREMEVARKIVELGLAERDIKGIKVRQPLRELRIKNYELRSEFVDLIKDELNVKNVVFEKGEGNISVELDAEITPELELEGMKREFVRLVNSLRKISGFSINDRINIFWQGRPIIGNMLEKFKDEILMETLANEITAGSEKELSDGKEFNLNKEMIVIAIEKN